MPRVRFSPDFTVGNIITLLVLAVSVIGGWFTLHNSVSANTLAIENNSQAIREVRGDVRTLETSALTSQVELTRILTELQADVRYLRQTIDALGARQ